MDPLLASSSAIVSAIIAAQAKIVGPLAWEQATLVHGLKIESDKRVTIAGEPQRVIKELVQHYEALFGRGAREVCREAVQPLLSDDTQAYCRAYLKRKNG